MAAFFSAPRLLTSHAASSFHTGPGAALTARSRSVSGAAVTGWQPAAQSAQLKHGAGAYLTDAQCFEYSSTCSHEPRTRTMHITMPTDTSSAMCWERCSTCAPQPMRVTHRGGPDGKIFPWDHTWRQCFNYSIDSCLTAVARPLVAPVTGGRHALAQSQGQSMPARVAATAAGGIWGLGKGLAGSMLSVGVAGICFLEGAVVGIGTGGAKLGMAIKQPLKMQPIAMRPEKVPTR